jgi:hypothetical protein
VLSSSQGQFDFDSHRWPDQDHFPLNLSAHKRTVQAIVYEDIKESQEYLILTGFTSLSNLIDFFGSEEFERLQKVCILIGFEPNFRGRKKYPMVKLDREIKEYWIKKGLSVMLGGAVMNLIEKINRKEVQFKFKDRLHAKLFVGENYAVLGSSNFSKNGLNEQDEANIRVCKNESHQRKQYEDIKLIGNSYWEESADYNQKIIELLENLIQQVTWEEALARAIAEMLEGEWLESYKEILDKLQNANLWPTQLKGLAQAMTILQSQSNVLIADPTGAGKTKMCTSIVLSLQHWLFESGRNHHTNAVAICPPLVVKKWNAEFQEQEKINSVISMGLLSNATEERKKDIEKKLQIAHILTVDEAHNYLSQNSNRTELLKQNRAGFKLLVTATPISKKLEDLLQLIELLDIDNLSDEQFVTFQELTLKRNKGSDQHVKQLRDFISTFTVRRTKRALNTEIQKEPEKYRNSLGDTCKFPTQIPETYDTLETEKDRKIVEKINVLAKQIKGITHLTKFSKPEFELTQEEHKEAYINNRIRSGKALCVYQIRAALRSSHVALVEHIEGTKAAESYFKFEGKSNTSGDKILTIQKIIDHGELPKKSLIFKNEYFPEWLTNKEFYLKACQDDRSIYEQISVLAKKLSGKRELGKLQQLIDIQKKHTHVLAFDSTVITLYYLRKLFQEKYEGKNILIASGSEKDKDSKKVLDVFSLTSISKEPIIALCSDKMSESVDLQRASAVVLLDLPSVLRIVEQRIGRADRMDSCHDSITIFWPNDSEEYSLKADKRIIDTNELVDKIYGTNVNIPEVLKEKHFDRTDSIDDIINQFKEFNDKEESWEGVNDSFQSVVSLKEGENSLITPELYQEYKDVRVAVRTRVSFVGSDQDWCFIALKGDKERSPRWYFIDSNNDVHGHLPDICQLLREKILKKSNPLGWQQTTLERYINLFKQKERELLPPKKKRALEVAESLLTRQRQRKYASLEEHEMVDQLLKFLSSKPIFIIDYEHFADEWITILQPYLNEKRANQGRRRKLFNLNSLKNNKQIILDQKTLSKIVNNTRFTEDIDSKIASCIIGVQSI